MGWKCTPQIKGLVRGDVKAKSKHRANAKAFCQEAGSERYSASETLVRDRSKNNQYEGFTRGEDAHDEMMKQADEYVSTYTDKNGIERHRRLKSDAVIGYAVIFNPPEEECFAWTEEQYQKFYQDSWDVLKELHPEMFSDEHVLMRVEHRDEGIGDNDYHQHIIGIPKDAEGKYCGNGINGKMLSRLNKSYPQMMRAKGWTEMDDLDTTDWKKYVTDDDYQNERDIKLKKHGKTVNEYIAGKTTAVYNDTVNALANVQEIQAQQQVLQQGLDAQKAILDAREENMRVEKEEWLKTQNTAFEEAKTKYEADLKNEYKAKMDKLEPLLGKIEAGAKYIKDTVDKLKTYSDSAVSRKNKAALGRTQDTASQQAAFLRRSYEMYELDNQTDNNFDGMSR